MRCFLNVASLLQSRMSIGNEFQADGAETAKALSVCPGMPKISYPDRLRKLKLPTLTYRRARGDMIETYKLLSGKYDDRHHCS